ncbi:FadR family transcriptional regulator [Arcanobacterium haemolyticum]|nr:FadR family transcriptional regulator [Arcanobacterium haemolyticum]
MDAESWKPIQRVRTHELVISQITTLLREGKLKSGDQLSSERELSAQLGISRTSLRESLRVLEALGIVEVRSWGGPDGGTIIRSTPGPGLVKVLELEVALGHFTQKEVLGTRIALEESSCGNAAEHVTTTDISELSAILDEMDDPSIDTLRFNELDTAFHVRIAQVGGNTLTAYLMESIREVVKGQMIDAYAKLPDWKTTVKTVRREHRELLKAIDDGDSAKARHLVRLHVSSFYDENFLKNKPVMP